MFSLYSLLYRAALVLLAPRALWDLWHGGRWGAALGQRLGAAPATLACWRGAFWVHAVSVGEVHAARGLIPHLRRAFPGCSVVVSTTTATGQALARSKAGADDTFFMPLDLPLAVAPYLECLRPRAVLLVETEIWPNFLRCCQERGVPVGLVNARLSERSCARYQMMSRWWPAPLRSIGLVCARTPDEATRFRALGIEAAAVWHTGNLKADSEALMPSATDRERLRQAFGLNGEESLLVAGCTTAGEEPLVLEAFARLRRAHPQLKLLLAPRRPERFDEVQATVTQAGFHCRRRSRGAGSADDEVLLLDTIGELPAAYGLGTVSFVGGSLLPAGGHNLLEPAIQGQPVLCGPHTDNFRDLAGAMESAGGMLRVTDGASLAATASRLLSDPQERQNVGERARQVALHDGRAGARTARVVRHWLQALERR